MTDQERIGRIKARAEAATTENGLQVLYTHAVEDVPWLLEQLEQLDSALRAGNLLADLNYDALAEAVLVALRKAGILACGRLPQGESDAALAARMAQRRAVVAFALQQEFHGVGGQGEGR